MKEYSLEGFTTVDPSRRLTKYKDSKVEAWDEMTGEYDQAVVTLITSEILEEGDATEFVLSGRPDRSVGEEDPLPEENDV